MSRVQRGVIVHDPMHRAILAITLIACRSETPARDRVVVAAPFDAASQAMIDAEPAPQPISTAPARRVWVPVLRTADDFEAYSKQLGGERFTKFVVDLKSDAIYYFDVDIYRIHKDFVFAELYKKPRTKEANRIFDANYTAQKPEFLLCYLVHHVAADLWTMAFWEGDKMTAEHVKIAYARMKATFFNGALVKFRPDSTRQERVAFELGGAVPVITNDQLYKSVD
jgi:hypothetical protein